MGEDNVTYEVDYPHSDALFPDAAELLWKQIEGTSLTDEQIEKITHVNAMKWLRFDPFEHNRREDLTVGACHARAKAKGVDTAPKASGGAVPLTENRPVTSGDVMQMFTEHAERRAQEKALA